MPPFRMLPAFLLLARVTFAQAPADLSAFLADWKQALSRSDTQTLAAMLAPDADVRIGSNVIATGADSAASELATGRVWIEQSPPLLSIRSIRMIAADAALVDATETRIGTLTLRETTPVLLVFRRTAAGWQIASVRFAAKLLCATPQ
jgi:ketosteroid isomerase-like protein